MKTKGVTNHERVYAALQAAGGPMSAYDLLDTLRVHGFEADDASIELQGTCATCRERASADA